MIFSFIVDWSMVFTLFCCIVDVTSFNKGILVGWYGNLWEGQDEVLEDYSFIYFE